MHGEGGGGGGHNLAWQNAQIAQPPKSHIIMVVWKKRHCNFGPELVRPTPVRPIPPMAKHSLGQFQRSFAKTEATHLTKTSLFLAGEFLVSKLGLRPVYCSPGALLLVGNFPQVSKRQTGLCQNPTCARAEVWPLFTSLSRVGMGVLDPRARKAPP